MHSVLVVLNLNSGRKRAIKYKRKVRQFLFENSEYFKFISLDELENENTDDFDTIIAIGGDGTVNKILPYLGDKTLGIIPCGTANLFAAKLGIPNNINKNLKIIKQNNIFESDVMEVNGRLSILRCGIGYDSNIICHTPQSLKNKFGYFAYFVAGILFALRLKKRKYFIRIDDKEVNIQAGCIIIANASNMFHNLVSVGNNTKLNDRIFEIFILKTNNPILFFIEFLGILFNIRKSSKRALYLKANNIFIKADYINMHIDGEEVKGNKEINCRFLPQKIKIYSAK